MNLGSEKDPWAPQDKHNGGSLFSCGGVPIGGPKETTQEWSSEKDPLVEEGLQGQDRFPQPGTRRCSPKQGSPQTKARLILA